MLRTEERVKNAVAIVHYSAYTMVIYGTVYNFNQITTCQRIRNLMKIFIDAMKNSRMHTDVKNCENIWIITAKKRTKFILIITFALQMENQQCKN